LSLEDFKRSRRANLRRLFRYSYLRVLRQRATPHQLALGLSFGVFGGCMPVLPGLPFQTAVGFLLAFVFRASKLAAVIATWVSNPFNWIFFYYVQYRIGHWLLPSVEVNFDPANLKVSDLMAIGWQTVMVLTLGGVVIGIPSGLATYFIFLPLIRRYRRRRSLKILEKKHRR
jgi:uncharacterized protein (DUF2062 family)